MNNTPRYFWEFDRLSASESIRLIRALSEEELGLTTSSGKLSHCSCRNHIHKTNGNTESLEVKPSLNYKVKRDERSENGTWKIICYGGGCQFNGRLSDYIASVGDPTGTSEFWSIEKVKTVCASLRGRGEITIGWSQWKISQGLESSGFNSCLNHDNSSISSSKKYSLADFLDLSNSLFKEPSSSLIDRVAKKRGWSHSCVEQCIREGIIGLTPSISYPDDVTIAFAYKGIRPSLVSPIRIIKTRLLERRGDEAPGSMLTIRNPVADGLPIADFSPASISMQQSPVLAFVEGEPDAISWRQMRPNDAVICLGNASMYSRLSEITPILNIQGRRIIYAIDKDIKDGAWTQNPKYHEETISSLLSHEAASVYLWVCPTIDGKPSKDANDFLRAHKDQNPASFTVKIENSNTFRDLMKSVGLECRAKDPTEIGSTLTSQDKIKTQHIL